MCVFMTYEMYVVLNHITKNVMWLYPSQEETFIKSIQMLFMYFIFIFLHLMRLFSVLKYPDIMDLMALNLI